MIIIQINQEQLEGIIDNAVQKALHESKDVFPEFRPSDEVFTIEQASIFLNVSKSTIYSLVSRSAIPNSKRGKRLYFSKKTLLDWIESGRRKTVEEISKELPKISPDK